MPKWESNAFAKIHEGCGGLVRWVEAFDDPHVGYTGECLECGDERVVIEDIIPIRCPDGKIATDVVNAADIGTLRDLSWDADADWDENQERLQQVIA